MIVGFTNIDFDREPMLILKNASDHPIGVLGYATDVAVSVKYNETSTISFVVPEYVDGNKTPLYDEVVGMRTVELQGVGCFTLVNPSEINDGIDRKKSCTGYSLEYEFTYKKLSLPKGTYRFWDGTGTNDTIMSVILEKMPSWSIGYIPPSICDKYRTFEIENENIYNFIKGTLQNTFGCIFDFDTFERKIYVKDVEEETAKSPIYVSCDNLAKEIEVRESTEDIYTRLDVNGAETVNIRDVNPCGSNKIINLDYYMNKSNFSQEIIDKYFAWKKLRDDNKQPFYLLSVRYSLKITEELTETAKLTDLKGELTNLENVQSVIISAIAQGLKNQSDLDEINNQISAKKVEIENESAKVDQIRLDKDSLFSDMQAITETCSFEKHFTPEELILIDRYIKDGEISDNTFVYTEVKNYSTEGSGVALSNAVIEIKGTLTDTKDASGNHIYEVRAGTLDMNDVHAEIISSVIDYRGGNNIVATVYMSKGSLIDSEFPSACISITGTGSIATGDGSVSISISEGYRYFTLNTTEYERRSVSWELFKFGEETINKMSQPTYTFSVDSSNFLALSEFKNFKNALSLGAKVYIDTGNKGVLQPITTGVDFDYNDPSSLSLSFSDSYLSSDSTFRLVDLLEQSISMGKNVEMSKYVYSSFVDSGASNGVKDFMDSALDVSKNNIISSSGQAMQWDGAGLRMRKWKDDSKSGYDPEQMWIVNNNILMTKDNWATAEMAIGKFKDANLGECWGIVAPRIVGTLLAGNALVIESQKQDGGIAQFKIDGEGCRIYNSSISVNGSNTNIVINPEVGIALGTYPVLKKSPDNADIDIVNENNAKFWVDVNGDVHLKGTLHGVDGEFTGTLHGVNGDFTGDIVANSLKIGSISIGDYVAQNGGNKTFRQDDPPIANATGDIWIDTNDKNKMYRWSGTEWVVCQDGTIKDSFDLATSIYNGEKGISFNNSNVDGFAINAVDGIKVTGADKSYFQVKNNAMGFFKANESAMLYYENGNMVLNGIIYALGGNIGGENGWNIGNDCIYNGNASSLGASGGIFMGTNGISIGSAITMEPDGSFVIRGDNSGSDQSNYVFKIVPEEIVPEQGQTDNDIIYKLYMGNIIFDDSFVVPIKNGGTGSSDKESIGAAMGLYRVDSIPDMQAIKDSTNGDLCVLYSAGSEGTSISGQFTNQTTTHPGFLKIGEYSASGHRNTSYFGISGMGYWNVNGLSKDTVSSIYGRVGVGNTVSGACAMYSPMNIVVSDNITGVSSIKIKFKYALRPRGATRDLCSTWTNGVSVSLYRGTGTGSSAVKVATTTYKIPKEWQDKSSTIREDTITLNSSQGIKSGEYYIVFYSRSQESLMWIIQNSVSTEGKSITATNGLYLKSGEIWTSIAGGGGGGGYVLPIASEEALGGVRIGSNISISKEGIISISKDNVTGALGYIPAKQGEGGGSQYVLPIATATELGGVIIGDNISISGIGAISISNENIVSALGFTPANAETVKPYILPKATADILGGVKIGNNITTDGAGSISVTSANIVNALGYTPAKQGEGGGTEYILPVATSSILGGVKIGGNITGSADGTISVTYSNVVDALGFTPADEGNIPVMSDYLLKNGDTMTGALTISEKGTSAINLQPDLGVVSVTHDTVVRCENSDKFTISMNTHSNGTSHSRIFTVNGANSSGVDDMLTIENKSSNGSGVYRVFHSGMTSTAAKQACESLGIFYADVLPATGEEGQICFVPSTSA